MFPKYKRILCLALSFLLCFSFCACKKEAPNPETEETQTKEETKKPALPSPDDSNVIASEEILYDMNTWLGRGDSGKLEQKGDYKITEIKSKKDLDPYKDYMYFLSQEDVDSLFAEKNGKCILVELTGRTEHTLYGTSSILREGDNITVYVSVEEYKEEVLPLHTYFLLHFPSEIYTDEKIRLSFIEVY